MANPPDPRAPHPPPGDTPADTGRGPRMQPTALQQTFAKLAGRPYDPATDRELIARFHQTRDESAFAALVDKHGPMVLGVCRRKLRDPHAADDAFQATFLILAKKAGRVKWQESLGGWLYQVAVHVCRKAVTRTTKREMAALTPDAEPTAAPTPPPSELSGILDEELRALPQSYRDPIVLCHLQGMTVEEAAKALAVSEGQLRGRLFRGREKLRERLTKRGVALSVSALVVSLTAATARAVPAGLRTAAVATATTGPVSTSVLTLTHEVLSAMSRTKFHLLVASAVLAAGLFTTGVVLKTAAADQPGRTAEALPAKPSPSPLPDVQNALAPQEPDKKDDDKKEDEKKEEKLDRRDGHLKGIDAAGNKLVLHTHEDKFDLPVDVGAKTTFTIARRPAKLSELKEGMEATVSFRGTEKEAVSVEAGWPSLGVDVKAVDPAGKQMTIKKDGDKGFEFDINLPVAADVQVEIDGIPAGLADVVGARRVEVEFAADKKTVLRIEGRAGKDELSATVKSVDAVNKSVTLTLHVNGHKDEHRLELNFAVTADCAVRLAGKDVKLADLTADMPVRCKFAADRRTVSGIWAGPPVPKEKDDD
jgi:RNA polymerase sigma factor (sigma-70 family)